MYVVSHGDSGVLCVSAWTAAHIKPHTIHRSHGLLPSHRGDLQRPTASQQHENSQHSDRRMDVFPMLHLSSHQVINRVDQATVRVIDCQCRNSDPSAPACQRGHPFEDPLTFVTERCRGAPGVGAKLLATDQWTQHSQCQSSWSAGVAGRREVGEGGRGAVDNRRVMR